MATSCFIPGVEQQLSSMPLLAIGADDSDVKFDENEHSFQQDMIELLVSTIITTRFITLPFVPL